MEDKAPKPCNQSKNGLKNYIFDYIKTITMVLAHTKNDRQQMAGVDTTRKTEESNVKKQIDERTPGCTEERKWQDSEWTGKSDNWK